MARRAFLLGTAGVVGLALVAAFEAPRFFAPRRAPSPFDDLLARLPAHDSAAHLGAAWLAVNKSFHAGETAQKLRLRLAARPLSAAIDSDLSQGRMLEAHGWVLPETLVLLCALAAKAE